MKKLIQYLGAAVYAVILSWASATAAGQVDLAFEAAWIRAMPPGMKMTAGYGRFRNTGTEAVELVSFSSPQFGEVSLHRTDIVDGVSRMREVTALSIAPGEIFELEPGGYHLMLMVPATPIAEGQRVTLQVTARDGTRFQKGPYAVDIIEQIPGKSAPEKQCQAQDNKTDD